MKIIELEDGNYGWNKRRTEENAKVRTMSDSQHRAVTMLAYYKHMFEKNADCFFNGNYKGVAIYKKFFLKALPIMLRTSNLPELNLREGFAECDWEMIDSKIESYLKYIDRKFGTWYAPLAA